MRITFTKIAPATCGVVVERQDGRAIRFPTAGASRDFPHDVLHYIVESELGVAYGIWGCVAAGGSFPGMRGLAGHRKPHARERSRSIWKVAGQRPTEFEELAGMFQRIALTGLDASSGEHALSMINSAWRPVKHARPPYDLPTVRRVCQKIRAWLDTWTSLGTGESVSLEWTIPIPRDLSQPVLPSVKSR